MARLARVVVPGHPHHITQRGNGRARTFFGNADYALYRDLLAEACQAANVEVWAWCLMPNHVHLILVPPDPDGLRRALAPVHRRYAGMIHARRKRTGHFWQGRFGAVVMDEEHLAAALRYVSLNPVRARLVERAQDWRWSSTRAHLRGADDGLTALAPIKDRFPRFADLLATEPDAEAFARLRAAETIGRPLGDHAFLARIERLTARHLRPGRRGPKPKPKLKQRKLNALSP
jgi:putative transposase